MGLDNEQKEQRDQALSSLEITGYKNELGYVFVSYKSDNWEKVFKEKVFQLQESGVRIYSDKNFDDENHPWLTTMEKNLKFATCVMLFVSTEYMKSLPTLIELLASIVHRKQIIPVYLQDKEEIKKQLDVAARFMEDEPVKATSEELDYLRYLIDSNPGQRYNSQMTSIKNSFFQKMQREALDVNSIRNAFDLILNSGMLQDNAFEKPLDTLLNTIRNAYDDAKRNDKGLTLDPFMSAEESDRNICLTIPPTEQIEVKKTERTGKKTQEREEFQPEPIELFSLPSNGTLTIGAVRERLASDLDFCKRLGDIRRTQLLYGGKSYMDYGMAAVLKGCNKVVEPYQINYYNYCVANPDKVSTAKTTATWTWSSNARKIIGFVGSGMLDSKINALFESFPQTMTINDLLGNFQKCCEEAYITKKNNLVIDSIKKLLNAYYF